MKYYDVNDNNNEVIERQNDSDYADKGYDFESSVMISRRERNKRKKGLKFIVKKKGRRYKKNEKKSIRNIFLKLKSKCIVITIIMFGTVYILFHLYFENHFFLGSEINCINISGKSVEDAEEYLEECIDDYTLTLKGRDGVTNVIYGNDFNLKYSQDISDVIKSLKQKQNESSWLKSIISSGSMDKNNLLITYNEDKLNTIIDKLNFFDKENIIEPENPQFIYVNNEFKIQDEVYGNKINKDLFKEKIKNAILSGQNILDIEGEQCYENPQYTKSSEKAEKIKNILNEYKDSKVIYDLGSIEENIDMNIMKDWIDIDENYDFKINKDKVREFVNGFADKYDTVGITRTMYSTSGRTVSAAGGDYGFKINREAETEELMKDIESRKSTTREPVYEQTGINTIINDIDKTCVEIDLTNQHLWFYKDGSIIAEGDIVSGCVANGTMTPEGTYKLKYKDKDSVLVGENYRSPVSFWMPFNGDIGLHDASWRYSFGGQIYMRNGSHGCVNLPYSLANDIFYNIEEGTPVVCYY